MQASEVATDKLMSKRARRINCNKKEEHVKLQNHTILQVYLQILYQVLTVGEYVHIIKAKQSKITLPPSPQGMCYLVTPSGLSAEEMNFVTLINFINIFNNAMLRKYMQSYKQNQRN